ncbi:PREDICTED: uncharacterized protein LOC109158800 [Ipomoea nil]|uniref:uncharacterized protein LOC109158800 n=1 Tax=Ipomoea nil TaxID=35883 RepID=UPI000901A186|nr:PREDICTED: uncharacterized protein LOC109158800 [Ipomoea nil]
MLHAFLKEHKVDWSKVIFNNLVHVITFNRACPGDIAKKMGYGFLKKGKSSSRAKTKKDVGKTPIPTSPRTPAEKTTPPIPTPEPVVVEDSSDEDNLVLSTLGKTGRFRSPVKTKTGQTLSPKADDNPREAISQGEENTKEISSQGEDQPKESSQEKFSERQMVDFDQSSPQDLQPQEPISAERNLPCSTQEPAAMDMEAGHLSLPQKPGSPAKTKEVTAELNEVPSFPQKPTPAEQVTNALTQEPALVEENANVIVETPVVPKAPAPVPEATPRPPTRDQVLRESIENDYKRVLQWQKWRTAPLETFIETFEAMKDEVKFALEWIGTKDVYEALCLKTIRRVYSYKVTNHTLGKDKAPVCIELNKPPLDPPFVEEMKDEYGREIDTAIEDEKTDSDKSENDDEDEDEEDNVEDADDENDDDDDDDDSGNDNNNRADPDYDSLSPLLVGPDCNEVIPERSPSHASSSKSDDKREASLQPEDVSNDHLEDLSRAIVPHLQPMDETPIKREEATVREGKLDASPIFISSASGGKMDAPPQGEQMDTSPTNIEDESPPLSPRNIMNLMRDTVHAAEVTHQQYLNLR